MSGNLTTIDAIIDAIGGNGPVGELTGAKASTVSMWKKSQSFPANTFLVITAALNAKGLSAPASLWGMKSPSEQETAA